MHIASRVISRICLIAGLAATALPSFRVVLFARHQAMAAPVMLRGMPALLAEATKAPVNVVLLLRPGAGHASQVLQTLRATGASHIVSLELVNGIAARVSTGSLSALARDPNLLDIAQDHLHQIYPVPDGAELNAQLAHAGVRQLSHAPAGQPIVAEPDTLQIIHADAAQNLFTGRGVRVAILDSGIDLQQPDLQNIVLRDAQGHLLYKDFTGTDLTDTVGHGTAVAGTIAAQGRVVYTANDTYRTRVYPAPANPATRFDDQTYFTFTGVAPGVKIMMAKIFDARLALGSALDSTIVQAIQWAIDHHADVISESWGGSPYTTDGTDIVAMADNAAVRAGITVVTADGNRGPGQGTVGSPADAPEVISVGATTDMRQGGETGWFSNYNAYVNDNLAPFSSRGPTSDGRISPVVMAPGSSAWATYPHYPTADGPSAPPYTIGQFGGTSQATPVTAGVAALVIQAYRSIHHGQRPSPAYVKEVLTSSADDLGLPASDQSAGRVNALRAVQTVLHHGPSVLVSGPLALAGMPGQRVSQDFTVTNSGSVPERVSFQLEVLHQVKRVAFGGTLFADTPYVFKFRVPSGMARLAASVYFDTAQDVPISSQQGDKPILYLAIYDPHGDLVNYWHSGITWPGFVDATAAHPSPGIWSAVLSQSGRHDPQGIRHFINMRFGGQIGLSQFWKQGGTVSPAHLTLQPGQTRQVTYTADPLGSPGTSIITLRAREQRLGSPGDTPVTPASTDDDRTASIPVVLTASIPIVHGLGRFSGTFSGGVGDQGFAGETVSYAFTVPPHVATLQVSVGWQHTGNWFLLGLVDPEDQIQNFEDNGLMLQANTPIDLSVPIIDAYLLHPMPGRWHIALFTLEYGGLYPKENFQGVVEMNQPLATLSTPTISAQSGGGAVPFSVNVANSGAGLQEYFSYPTTDVYQLQQLGATAGTLQAGSTTTVAATQVLTYTTSFVPPGTREILTQAQGINRSQPVNIELDDPWFATHGYGAAAGVAIGGHYTEGSVALVRGANLPIGNWSVSLSLPVTTPRTPLTVASTTEAYALSPDPWIHLSSMLNANGSFTSAAVFALPGTRVSFKGTVRVPENVSPGTYHAHVFIYTVRADLIADLPLTIIVNRVLPAPIPTVDPTLASTVSSQYFPEGATTTGLSDTMDLVNPGSLGAHVQIKLLTDQGWTTVAHYAMGPHSRTTLDMRSLVGEGQSIAAIVQGDAPIVGGRHIDRSGEAGTYSVGAPAPARTWYFADGYTVGTFAEFLAIVNPGTTQAKVHLHLVSDQGDVKNTTFTVNGSSRYDLSVADLLSNKAVSATLSSSVPVVAERTQLFGDQGQGVTTTMGTPSGSTSGYLDPGHLPADAQAHLSLYNPGRAPAMVRLTLIDQHGVALRRLDLMIRAGQRATVDFAARYHTANLGALLSSNEPVVAEKVAYFGNFRQVQVGSSDLLAQATPAAAVLFPGGSTAAHATDDLGIYNPGATPLTAALTVIYGGNHLAHATLQVAASRRASIDLGALRLPAGASSVLVRSEDGSPFYATQTMVNATHTDGAEVSGVPVPAP
jgi:subtilisin family serine protease